MDAARNSPDDLPRLVNDLQRDLAAAGLPDAASRLAAVQGTAFTTRSAWLGELGRALNEIRAAHELPQHLRARLEILRARVRRVWPLF